MRDTISRNGLTSTQQAIWLAGELHPGSAVNNVAVAFRLTGPLDVPALRAAFTRVLARHGVLRTAYPGGVPRVTPPAPFDLPLTDGPGPAPGLASPSARPGGAGADAWVDAPFDVERGPLVRARLVRTGEHEHVLTVVLHQLVSDGPSLHLLFAELAAGYAGEPAPPPLPAQFHELPHHDDPGALPWWREALAGAPTRLELPTDRPRPAIRDATGAVHLSVLPAEVMTAVTDFAGRERVTGFVVTLAAYGVWLSRHTGQDDLLVGTPVNTRATAGTSAMIGMFAATLPVRIDLTGEPTFRTLVRRVRDAVLDVLTFPAVPFEQLATELDPHRDPGRTALYQTLFTYEPSPLAEPRFPGLVATPVDVVPSAAKVDLDLNLIRRTPGGDDFLLTVAYRPALFDESTVTAFADRYRRLLTAAVTTPDTPVHTLPVLSPTERRAVLHDWSGDAERHPRTDTALGRMRAEPIGPAAAAEAPSVEVAFARRAGATPDAVAVRHGGVSLTYAGLDALAAGYAERLRAAGAGPGVLVAVRLPRGPQLIAALLGVLRCGAAYLPLDVDHPAPRIATLIATARATLLLDGPRTPPAPIGDGEVTGEPHDAGLAYVLFTSGSTGVPKPVAVSRAALGAHARAVSSVYRLGPADRVLQFAGPAFDVAAEEIFPTLATGGCVVLRADPAPAPAELSRFLDDEGVTVVNLPSSYWQAWRATLTGRPATLRLAVIGSEPVAVAETAAWARFPGIELINAYGLTETTITATVHHVTGTEQGAVPIGRPLPGVVARVLGRHGEPVPPGVPGELHIGGSAPALGHPGDPERSAARFVPDRFGRPGDRLVRTGDLARWLPGGILELLGRRDGQLKIRGHRVEPGEVEAVLAAHPEVSRAAVTAFPDGRGGHRLAGFVVTHGGGGRETPDGPHRRERREVPGDLRGWLTARLPLYLVPETLTVLDDLPVTAGGKIDRAALPRPESRTATTAAAVTDPPRPGAEQDVAGIWRSALGVERIGRHDSFFDLGGSSFTAVTVRAGLVEALGRDIPMVTLFEHPTVAALAAHLFAPETAPEGAGPEPGTERDRLRAGRARLMNRRTPKEKP
ncbi:non-ribosomal peptide synthetase [Actinoplanes sp. G11-F43]|uniref:non-ribosomal peptide synthetase n=1 Tax=Actinoplanes sp. G11-F43 TaxID=3424130 RepID=UPI003D34E7F2